MLYPLKLNQESHLFFFLLLPDRSRLPNQTQPHLRHENDLLLPPPPSEEAAADSLFALRDFGWLTTELSHIPEEDKHRVKTGDTKEQTGLATVQTSKWDLSTLSPQFWAPPPSSSQRANINHDDAVLHGGLADWDKCYRWGAVTFAKSIFLGLLFVF